MWVCPSADFFKFCLTHSVTLSNSQCVSRTQRKRKVSLSADGTPYISVTVKLPQTVFDEMRRAIRHLGETDQSKFVRSAVRSRIAEALGKAA